MENLESLGSFDTKKLIQEIQERLNKELKGAEKRISKSSNGSFRTKISESSNIDGTPDGIEDAVKPNEVGRKVVSTLLKDYEESMLFHLSPLLTVSDEQLLEGRVKSRKLVFENLVQISEEQDVDSEKVKTKLNEILSAKEEVYSREIIIRNANVKKLTESALTDFQQRMDTAIDPWILDFTTIIPSNQPSLFISGTPDNEEKSLLGPSSEFRNCNVNQKSDSTSLYWNTMSQVLQSHVLLGMPSKYHKEFKIFIEKDTKKIQEILFQLQTSFTTYERYMTSRFETHLCLSTEYFNGCHQAALESCLQKLQDNSKYVINLHKGIDNYKKQFEVRNRLISENCKQVAEQTIPSVKKFYVDLLTNFVKDEAVQRDELQKLHKEVVKECLRGFTKACDFHPNSGIRSYEAELRTELELQRQTFEMLNNRKILKMSQQTNDFIEYHRKLYNEKMNLFMAKEDIEASELEIFNESKQKEVCSLLEQKIDEDKGNNPHFVSRDQAEKKLKKQIEDDWECLKELNRTKTMRRALESAQKELESQESLVQMRLKERKLANHTQSIARDNEPHISPSVSTDSSDQKYNMLLSQEFDEQIQVEVQCIRTKYFAAIHKVKYEFELQSVHDHELEQATNTLRQFSNKLVDDSTKQQHVKQLEKGLQLELDRKRSMIRKAKKEFPISESSPANANVFRQGIKIDKRKKTKSKSHDNKASPLPGNQPLKQDDANQENQVMSELLKTYEEEYKKLNDMNVPVDPAIGIDLGTTYSCVAVYWKGKVTVIPNAQGKNTTPSYVCYNDKGFAESVGDPAKSKAYENAENTIYDAKRIIGRKFEDEKLQNDMKFWAFKVVDEGQVPKIQISGKAYYPEQISAEVLKEMRVVAEKHLDCVIKNAVITVPAYFTDGQKQATVDAGELAGLKVLNILSEPTAAAVAYNLQHTDDTFRHALIFDLGGGTFDVAVVKMSKGNIEILAVDGDTHLGGEDFDQNIMKYCALEFQREHGIDLMEGKDSENALTRHDARMRLKRLQLRCEGKKIELASSRKVDVCVDEIWNDGSRSLDLKVTLTREKFEELNDDLFEKTIKIVEEVLRSASIKKSRIQDIVLVGGSTRIPKVQELLSDFFDGKALNKTINPDEAVAYGAAVQAAMMNGKIALESTDYNKIQDVNPMSLGVEVYSGEFSAIILKNTKLPTKIKEQYRTAHKNQTSVQIAIYQGEDTVAQKHEWLGEFYLNGIPPADAGRETIDVTMEIGLQGILHVTAVCTSTGDTGSIKVTEHKR